MRPFYRTEAGAPGIEMAYFNLREGRFRQSNLHLVKPALLGNRHYVEEMYEHRYQKQIGNIVSLAWRIFWRQGGGLRLLAYYAIIHAAAVADRRGWLRLADLLRRWIGISRVEEALGGLLRTRFRFVTTEVGGCAVDIDNEEDYETAKVALPGVAETAGGDGGASPRSPSPAAAGLRREDSRGSRPSGAAARAAPVRDARFRRSEGSQLRGTGDRARTLSHCRPHPRPKSSG